MLRKRLISSTIIISFLTVLVATDLTLGTDAWLARPGLILVPVLLLLIALATKELTDLFSAFPVRPAVSVVILSTVLAVGFACAPMAWRDYPDDCPIGKSGWTMFGLAAAIGLIFVHEMFRYREPGQSITRISLSVLAVIYLGLLASFLPALRLFHSNQWGMAALLSMIVVTKISDVGAYTTGKLFGKRKLSPRLSPNKTVEGAVGAFAFGCLASVLMFLFLFPWLVGEPNSTPLWAMLVYGVIVISAGMLGDLAESLLKRDAQQKDSSRWLPGLGGALDVLDSVLVAAPAAFACWVSGLVGPLGG